MEPTCHLESMKSCQARNLNFEVERTCNACIPNNALGPSTKNRMERLQTITNIGGGATVKTCECPNIVNIYDSSTNEFDKHCLKTCQTKTEHVQNTTLKSVSESDSIFRVAPGEAPFVAQSAC